MAELPGEQPQKDWLFGAGGLHELRSGESRGPDADAARAAAEIEYEEDERPIEGAGLRAEDLDELDFDEPVPEVEGSSGGSLLDAGLIPPPLSPSAAARRPAPSTSSAELESVGSEDLEPASLDDIEAYFASRESGSNADAAAAARAAAELADDEDSDEDDELEELPADEGFDPREASDELEAVSPSEVLDYVDSRKQERPSAAAELEDSGDELEAMSPEEAAQLLGDRESVQAPPTSSQQNVRQILESNSEAMTLRNLAKRGVKNVRVMDMGVLQRIMTEAVDKVMQRRDAQLADGERERIEAEAKKEFFRLVQENKKLNEEKSAAERASAALQGQVDQLTSDLDSQKALLSEENKRFSEAKQVRFSAESFDEMAAFIHKEFRRHVDDELKSALETKGPDAVPGLEALGESIQDMLRSLLAREREAAIELDEADHNERVRILEARIRKLNNALDNTESALKKVAAMKQVDGGIASIFDGVQGLSFDDGNFEKKSELLKVIFLENLEIQGVEITDADREVMSFRSPDKVAEAADGELSLPDGFSQPIDVDTLTSESAF